MTRYVLRHAATLILAGLLSGASVAAEIEGALPAGDDPGSRERRYVVHAPEGVEAGAALVMALHGCKQTHRDIMAASRFQALADANAVDADPSNDFIVVFPFVTSYPSFWEAPRATNCWGWWFDAHRLEGQGEAADLRRLLAAVEAAHGTDPERRYVAGLSSGAAMSVAMGVSYSEDVAAVGSVAGVPFGERADAVAIAWPLHHMQSFWAGVDANCLDAKLYRTADDLAARMRAEQTGPGEGRLTPLMVIHSAHDCTVEQRNAKNLRDAWRLRYQAGTADVLADSAESSCAADGVACRRSRYVDAEDRVVVETVIYDGRRGRDTHYWVGDTSDAPYSNADGPSATCLLLDFFGLSPTEPTLCP